MMQKQACFPCKRFSLTLLATSLIRFSSTLPMNWTTNSSAGDFKEPDELVPIVSAVSNAHRVALQAIALENERGSRSRSVDEDIRSIE
jgi:hypothetical protein